MDLRESTRIYEEWLFEDDSKTAANEADVENTSVESTEEITDDNIDLNGYISLTEDLLTEAIDKKAIKEIVKAYKSDPRFNKVKLIKEGTSSFKLAVEIANPVVTNMNFNLGAGGDSNPVVLAKKEKYS
jgi:hypothetical protein